MKKLLFIAILAFGCSEKETRINLTAYPKEAIVYNYQDVYCSFKANGLENALQNKSIDSVSFKVTVDGIERMSDLKLKNDSTAFEFRADLLVSDSITETFSDSVINYKYVGHLTTYSNGLAKKNLDTISIKIINPLNSSKMTGELKDGKRSGYWYEYYDSQKTQLARKSYFNSGKRHGSDSIFKNDDLYYVIDWNQGHKDGKFRIFWPNGATKYETSYKGGKPIEPVTIYNDKGDKTGSFELR
jgi:antitoxin component YwqK of YwqJK toxin-antitoxin module